MATRHLYIVRHGAADAFGELTDIGRKQVARLGERLADIPVTAIWHSPLSRAAATAKILHAYLPAATVAEAEELIDHVPHVPDPVPPAWAGFFDGYDRAEAEAGARTAAALTARFARPAETEAYEVLVTHAYPIAWLVRDALGAPPVSWLGLPVGNTGLTAIEYRDGTAPTLLVHNDMGHLENDLRWTGFGPAVRP